MGPCSTSRESCLGFSGSSSVDTINRLKVDFILYIHLIHMLILVHDDLHYS